MIPMRSSSVFKSRWIAVLWAAGILWLAWDVAASEPQGSNASTNAEQATDATDAPISAEDQKKFAEIVNGL